MKLVIQYVSQASVVSHPRGGVAPAAHPGGVIRRGYVVLTGISVEDTSATVTTMAQKLLSLRCIPDDQGKINLSIQDIKGELLLISQFTLYADTGKGNRPSFTKAAPPEKANQLFATFVGEVKKSGLTVATGEFRTHMQVSLVNDGPITIILEN